MEKSRRFATTSRWPSCCDLQIILQYGAVAVNRRVVRKRDHEATYLRAGDRIEIVRPVGGGCMHGQEKIDE